MNSPVRISYCSEAVGSGRGGGYWFLAVSRIEGRAADGMEHAHARHHWGVHMRVAEDGETSMHSNNGDAGLAAAASKRARDKPQEGTSCFYWIRLIASERELCVGKAG